MNIPNAINLADIEALVVTRYRIVEREFNQLTLANCSRYEKLREQRDELAKLYVMVSDLKHWRSIVNARDFKAHRDWMSNPFYQSIPCACTECGLKRSNPTHPECYPADKTGGL